MEGGLTIDWKVLIGQIVNFAILFFVLKKFAYAPFLEIMKKRRDEIEKGVNKSKEAEESLNKVREVKERADKENEERKKQIILEAEKEGKEKINEAVVLAEKEKESILLKAFKDAETIKEKEKERTEKMLIENSFVLAESLLKENIDEEKNKKITEEFLRKI
jgi:F-type H+-transporting ATPase subunit b